MSSSVFIFFEESSKGSEDSKVTRQDEFLNHQNHELDSTYVYDPPKLDPEDRRSELGRGTYGTTFRVKNVIDNGVYAVKQVKRDEVSGGSLLKEIGFLRQLYHPNIVRYFTCFKSLPHSCIVNVVLELVENGSLSEKIVDSSVTMEVIVSWLKQLSSALSYLHNNMKIQHRDIKPDNILLAFNNEIKLIDFGCACTMNSSNDKVGTERYFSYEKAFELPYDGRDDVWAAGCVIAELITKTKLIEPIYLHSDIDIEINNRRLQLIADCINVDAYYGDIVSLMLVPEQLNRCTSEELLQLVSGTSLNNSNPEALFAMGQRYSSGIDLNKSNALAFKFHLKAADLGHVKAQIYTGRGYYFGDGTEIDYKMAYKYLKMASDQNHPHGHNGIACCLKAGLGVAMNQEEAFNYFRMASEQGMTRARHNLGNCYLKGIGTAVDKVMAEKCFKLAAADGYYDLALFYKSEGGDENNEKALSYFRKAESCGNQAVLSEEDFRFGIVYES